MTAQPNVWIVMSLLTTEESLDGVLPRGVEAYRACDAMMSTNAEI